MKARVSCARIVGTNCGQTREKKRKKMAAIPVDEKATWVIDGKTCKGI